MVKNEPAQQQGITSWQEQGHMIFSPTQMNGFTLEQMLIKESNLVNMSERGLLMRMVLKLVINALVSCLRLRRELVVLPCLIVGE